MKTARGAGVVVKAVARGRAVVAQMGKSGTSDTIPVTIKNNSGVAWKAGAYVLQAIWLDGRRRRPIADAPQTLMQLGKGIKPGGVLKVNMRVPTPPVSGSLFLWIDVVQTGVKHLDVGPVVPVRAVL